ncbi:unnamed protein product, partial [Musa banksii]
VDGVENTSWRRATTELNLTCTILGSACRSLRCLNWAEAVESYSELWVRFVGYYVFVV